MKRRKIDMLFLITLFTISALTLSISDHSSNHPLELTQSEIPIIADNPKIPHGYTEDNFTVITIEESDIFVGDVVASPVSETLVECFANFSYPEATSEHAVDFYWKIVLPEKYFDATEYYIQRSESETYLTFYDTDQYSTKDTGIETYWEIPITPSTIDILHFSITPTLIDSSLNQFKSNDTSFYYETRINRYENNYHTFDDVLYFDYFPNEFDNYFIKIISVTGGEGYIKDITDTASYTAQVVLYIDENGNQDELIEFTMEIGTIYIGVDYGWDILIYREQIVETYFSNIYTSILLPLLGAGIGSYVMFAPIKAFMAKRRKILRKNFKTYLVIGLILFVFFEIFMYLIFIINKAQDSKFA